MSAAELPLACNSMHLPWWVGPAVVYLLVGWAVGAVLALANSVALLLGERSPRSNAMNVVVWALYAVPMLIVALGFCHIASPQVGPVPEWLVSTVGIYGLLVPLIAVAHSVSLYRGGSASGIWAG